MNDNCTVCDSPFKRKHHHQNLCDECAAESQRAIKDLPPDAIQSVINGMDKDVLRQLAEKCTLVSLTNVGIAKAMETSLINLDTHQTTGAVLLAVNSKFFQAVLLPMMNEYYRQQRQRNEEGEEWKRGRQAE